MGKNKPKWDKTQWQGRSKRQIETNYQMVDITIKIAIMSFIGYLIYSLIAY